MFWLQWAKTSQLRTPSHDSVGSNQRHWTVSNLYTGHLCKQWIPTQQHVVSFHATYAPWILCCSCCARTRSRESAVKKDRTIQSRSSHRYLKNLLQSFTFSNACRRSSLALLNVVQLFPYFLLKFNWHSSKQAKLWQLKGVKNFRHEWLSFSSRSMTRGRLSIVRRKRRVPGGIPRRITATR